MKFIKPTLVIDKTITKAKIKEFAEKFAELGIEFRPHFKTHNSIEVGSWFRECGVEKITVSSVEMAEKFAKAGWRDIFIAFPVNILEIDEINYLAERSDLTILIDNVETAYFLEHNLKRQVAVNFEIDTGKGRSGRSLDGWQYLEQSTKYLKTCNMLRFNGITTHAGHSYDAKNQKEIIDISQVSLAQMRAVQAFFIENLGECKISIGDTPTAVLSNNLQGASEIRPGVFVYFDLMMKQLGVCSENEISAYVIAPICGIYPERSSNNVMLYAGAIHLSKDSIKINNNDIFGKIIRLDNRGIKAENQFHNDIYIEQLSQEHAMCTFPKEFLEDLKIGDLLGIIPVHACLTANILKNQTVL